MLSRIIAPWRPMPGVVDPSGLTLDAAMQATYGVDLWDYLFDPMAMCAANPDCTQERPVLEIRKILNLDRWPDCTETSEGIAAKARPDIAKLAQEIEVTRGQSEANMA